MNSSLTKMKQSFIEYLLFHYEFKSRISVWVLNYLKASPKTTTYTFRRGKIQQHMTLQIAEVNSDALQFNLTTINKHSLTQMKFSKSLQITI